MKRRNNKKSYSGMILVLAVVIVLVLAIIGIGLLHLGRNARLQAVKDVLQISARSAADAGMEHASRSMINWWNNTSGRSYDAIDTYLAANIAPVTGQLNDTFGEADYSYTIAVPGSGVGIADITSTGTAGNVTRTVHAKLGLRSEWESIGVDKSIDIGVKGGLFTIPEDEEFTIQTNSIISPPSGGIVLRLGLHVPGDVFIGPGGETVEVVDAKNKVTVAGEVNDAPEFMEFLSNFPPDYILGATITPIDGNDPNIIIHIINTNGEWTGDLNIKTLTGDPEVVKIDGHNDFDADGQLIPLDIYINGDVTLGNGGILTVTPGSAVNLYLGGSLYAKYGSEITYEGMPEDPHPVDDMDLIIEAAKSLTLLGTDTCTSIILANSSDFYGTINAPDPYLEIKNDGDVYGAIMASMDLKIYNDGDFYFVSELYEFLDIETMFMGIIPGTWWEE